MALTLSRAVAAKPVVLTVEGRSRLESRLAVTREQLDELERQLGSQDTADLLAERLRLRERIALLNEALSRSVSVDEVVENPDIVELGDEVEIEYDGERARLVLVHPLEADADRGHVSIDAPLARALLGRRVGDEVSVAAPMGSYRAQILGRSRSH